MAERLAEHGSNHLLPAILAPTPTQVNAKGLLQEVQAAEEVQSPGSRRLRRDAQANLFRVSAPGSSSAAQVSEAGLGVLPRAVLKSDQLFAL